MSSRITRSASRSSLNLPKAGSDAVATESKLNGTSKIPKRPRKTSAAQDGNEEDKATLGKKDQLAETNTMGPPPSTPSAKRTKRMPKPQPQLTPTPTIVKDMAGLHSSGDIDDAMPSVPRGDRPAEPHTTNALLRTPRGSKVGAYAADGDVPIKAVEGNPTPPTTSTAQILEEACAHLLKVDPSLKTVIDQNYCRIFSPEGLAEVIDPFRSLTTGIMGQQVSGAAASSIKRKFIALFNQDQDPENVDSWVFPTSAQVAAKEVPFLRTAGLSERKAEYIKGLAEKFASGELNANLLIKASDEEIFEKLTAIRGLGRWSVEMFACFALKRMDIFSTGDLGVQRGMASYKGRDVNKLKAKGGKWKYMSEQEMLDIAAKFAPYRSLFMWYMWRIEDVNVDAIQNN